MAHFFFFFPHCLSLILSSLDDDDGESFPIWRGRIFEAYIATLLESRQHHHRHRVLSRKAREVDLYDEDPSRRQVANVCVSDVIPHNPVTENVVTQSRSTSTWQLAQRWRRDRERLNKTAIRERRQLRSVSSDFSNSVSHLEKRFQIWPSTAQSSTDRVHVHDVHDQSVSGI